MNKRTILLGIDPSFVSMGAAVYDPSDKSLKMKTGDLLAVITWLGKNCRMAEVIAVVENPALDSTVFKMWGLVQQAIHAYVRYKVWQFTKAGKPPPQKTINDVGSEFRIAMNHAQKVGENKAAAKLIIKLLHEKGVPVLEIAPSKRQKAFKHVTRNVNGEIKKVRVNKNVKLLIMPTKTDRDQFSRLTGMIKMTSYDSRDAATLVYNQTCTGIMNRIKIEQAIAEAKPESTPSTKNNNYYLLKRKKI